MAQDGPGALGSRGSASRSRTPFLARGQGIHPGGGENGHGSTGWRLVLTSQRRVGPLRLLTVACLAGRQQLKKSERRHSGCTETAQETSTGIAGIAHYCTETSTRSNFVGIGACDFASCEKVPGFRSQVLFFLRVSRCGRDAFAGLKEAVFAKNYCSTVLLEHLHP